ncbi:MAG: hypothetical protein Tsb009_23230 [Planctomycetaceae bacterium]
MTRRAATATSTKVRKLAYHIPNMKNSRMAINHPGVFFWIANNELTSYEFLYLRIAKAINETKAPKPAIAPGTRYRFPLVSS